VWRNGAFRHRWKEHETGLTSLNGSLPFDPAILPLCNSELKTDVYTKA
jgi:hypothetical protein